MLLRWVLYAALIAAPALAWGGAFPLDDAYITMHNARSLHAGWDATYDASPLTGATSLIHLLLVAGFGLVMPLPWASLTVGLAGTAAYAAALDKLAENLQSWRRPALVLAGLAAGTVPHFVVNGLETSLAMATVAWLLVLRDDRKLCWLVGLSPFVRPEIAVLGAALLARQLWALDGGSRLRCIALAAGVAAPFVAWSALQTGHVVPGTMAAKIAFFRESPLPLGPLVQILCKPLLDYGLWPLLVGVLALRCWPSWTFMVALVGTVAALVPTAFDWNYGRYLAPLLPVLVMGIAQGERTAVIGFVAGWAGLLLPVQLGNLEEIRDWYRFESARLAEDLGELPRGTVVLVHDAGMPAWSAPHLKLVDVVGLKTPASIAVHQTLTRRSCEWGAAMDRIATQSGARYALVLQKPYWRCVGESLRDAGWQMRPIGADEYQLFRIVPR